MFDKSYVTEKGLQTIATALEGGKKVEFSYIKIGNGIYSEDDRKPQNIRVMTELKSEVANLSYGFADKEYIGNNKWRLRASIDNETFTESKVVTEIGIYATVEGVGTCLYSVAVTDMPEIVPAYNGKYKYTIVNEFFITLSNEIEVTIKANQGVYALADSMAELQEQVDKLENNKIDKVTGKGLSTNDYTNTEKEKLKGIAEGAEVNVQSDWNETNKESDAYIKNKPTSLPASDVSEWAKANTKPTYTKSEVGLGNVPNVSTNDQTPTFTQAGTRANIASGEKLSTILGKVMKWFADIKAVAFSGSYTDLSNKPTIPSKLSELTNDSGYKTTDNNTTYSAGAQLELSNTVFRLKDSATRITDWNSTLTNGWYWGTNDALNSPPSGLWHYGIVIAHSANWLMQIVYTFGDYSGNSSTVKQYWRIMINGEWKEWVEKRFLGYDGNGTNILNPDGTGLLWHSNNNEVLMGAWGNSNVNFAGIRVVTFETAGTGGRIEPYGNNNHYLGSATFKWKEIYAASSTIVTSDKNEKTDIKDLDVQKIIDFIVGLKPKSFKFIDGDSGRTHYGMLSNDVEEMLEKLGMSTLDFAGFIKSPKTRIITEDENGEQLENPVEEIVKGEYIYGLRYEEFISPLIKMVQIQHEKLSILEKENAELKEKVGNIESTLEEIKNKLDM